MTNGTKEPDFLPTWMSPALEFLVKPSQQITGTTAQRNARLVSAIYLSLSLAGVIYWLSNGENPMLVLFTFLIGYGLSRTRYSTLAALSLVVSLSGLVFALTIMHEELDISTIMGHLTWLAFPFILSSLLFSIRFNLFYFLSILLGLLLLTVLIDEITFNEISSSIGLVTLLSATILLVMRQRNVIEALRQKELREQRNFLQQVIDTNADIIFVKDQAGRYVLANQAWIKAVGKPAHELIGKTDEELNRSPALVEKLRLVDQQVFSTGKEIYIPNNQVIGLGDDHRLWFETRKRPIYNQDGEIQYLLGIVSDVTQYKQTEQMLLTRNARLEILNQISREISLTIDLSEMLQTIAHHLAELLPAECIRVNQWDRQEQTVRVVAEFTTGKNQHFCQSTLGRMYPLETLHPQQTLWLENQPQPPLILHRKPAEEYQASSDYEEPGTHSVLNIPLVIDHVVYGYLETTHNQPNRAFNETDIHFAQTIAYQMATAIQNIQLYQAKQESEATIRALLEAIPDPMFQFNRAGKFIQYIPGKDFEPMIQPDQFLGKNITEILPPHVSEPTMVHIANALDTGQPQVYEYSLHLEDGEQRHYEARMMPVNSSEVISLVRNITQRVKAEQLVRSLNEELEIRVRKRTEELEQANQELTNFAYVVSHDLKAPLRGILQLAHWLEEDYGPGFDTDGQEMLTLLQGRTRRMQGLINGILQFSRVGRIKTKDEAVDLMKLIPEIVSDLAPPDHIQITIHDSMPTIYADHTQVSQVFQNLISNSLKFMDKPQGIVSISCTDQDTTWEIQVQDNGPGIAPEYHTKVFQLFQTLHPRDELESTGIGLALVKKIIEWWGGKIRLESQLGEGSTFIITLPKGTRHA